MNVCEWCGAEFEQTKKCSWQRFCSKNCRDRASYHRNHGKDYSPRKCLGCGEVFTPAKRVPHQKYCSPRCRGTHWSQLNAAKRTAQQRKWRKEHPKEARMRDKEDRKRYKNTKRAAQRRYYEKNKTLYKAAYQKRQARKVGLLDTLTLDEAKEKLANGTCFYCGRTRGLTLDHFIPISKGGPTTRANTVIACGSCNSSKGAKLPHEFLGQLSLCEPI